MNPSFKKYLLQVNGASDCFEREVIQRLWSDYGKISRYELIGSTQDTVVVKCIALAQQTRHPHGWSGDVSHQRKVKSYRVETNWYQKWGRECNGSCRIPNCLGAFAEGAEQWIILEDLNAGFPVRKESVVLAEIEVCLRWLANFHACFMDEIPDGLWSIGTYWHLDTRPEEFKKLTDPELIAKAPKMDDLLNNCRYQTFVHGDAKLANFCFSADGKKVAAVDFQYVGGGCGMKDVAYFLGSCLSGDEQAEMEQELLEVYFCELEKAIQQSEKASVLAVNFEGLKQEWMELYPVACADFTRFLLGWKPEHYKVNAHSLKVLKEVLGRL